MKKELKKMYKVKKIMENVYGIMSSCVVSYLVIGKTGAIVIDTAYGFEDLSAVVKELTDLPLTIVNSHGHIDHSGGNFYFESEVCIHKNDVDVYKWHNQPEFHRYMEKALKLFNSIIFWRTFIPKNPERNDEKRANFDNWQFIKDGDCFDLGDLTAEIIEIPGHTQGSVAVYFPEIALMITSDGANPGTWLFLPESAPLSVYINSLKKLKQYRFDFILTGHSFELMPRSELDNWLHVAEHPNIVDGKPGKEEIFAPGIKQITCWSTDDPKHKGPSIVLDLNKIDTGVK